MYPKIDKKVYERTLEDYRRWLGVMRGATGA